MMRFLLFGGHDFHPAGGAADLLCIGDDLEEMRSLLTQTSPPPHPLWTFSLEGNATCFLDWWHIVDFSTRTVVAYGGDHHRSLDYPDGLLDVAVYDRDHTAA